MIHIFRLSNFLYRCHVPFLPWLLRTLNRLLFGVVLPPQLVVGRNVLFGYQGLGIVVHRHAVIGNNVLVSQQVTLGGRAGLEGAPHIEDDVLIGAGARVLGPIRIGKGAKIGANAVVVKDVPAGATVVGIPARIVRPKAIADPTD